MKKTNNLMCRLKLLVMHVSAQITCNALFLLNNTSSSAQDWNVNDALHLI